MLRDWLIVSSTGRGAKHARLERLAVQREPRQQRLREERLYFAARREYAFVLRERGMTWRKIGEHLGVSGTRASGMAYRRGRELCKAGLAEWQAEKHAFMRL